jgi:hypothetical protein
MPQTSQVPTVPRPAILKNAPNQTWPEGPGLVSDLAFPLPVSGTYGVRREGPFGQVRGDLKECPKPNSTKPGGEG